MKPLHVFLLTIGREILVGRTLDTNAHWLAGEVTRLGGVIRQIACVDDVVASIASEIRAARRLGVGALITTGGLGPTHDDVTLAGISEAAGVRLRVHPAARRMMEARYRALHAEGRIADPAINPARLKMARLPAGARPIANAVGTAPGAHLTLGALEIFALPGVPPEMKAMFAAEVAPRVGLLARRGGGGAWAEVSLASGSNDESKIAPALEALRTAFPDVYVKSHAPGFGADRDVVVTLAAGAATRQAARARALAARRLLEERLKKRPRKGPS